jgi:GNAT superfamily N-acetyltransferase
MCTQPFDIRQVNIASINRQEVNVAIEWARQEGWNPGVEDASCFYQTDPNGFFAAKFSGEIVGTISIVKYNPNYAFVGLMIVRPDLRSKGIGKLLFNFLDNYFSGITVGLDGVEQMQPTYERHGFKYAHKNQRYAGIANDKFSARCIPIKNKNVSKLLEFDARHFTVPRPMFQSCWLRQKDAHSFIIQKQGNEICGYGVLRRCYQGYKIGPLFANTQDDAKAVFESLMSVVPGEDVFLDVPEPNTAAVTLAQDYGMKPVFATVRMYTKQPPKLPLKNIYGITSFELG